MEIRSVGASALLVDLADSALGVESVDPALVEAWRATLWQRRAAGEFVAMDIVPGARTVLVDGKTNTFVAVGTDAFIDRYSGEQAAFAHDAACRTCSTTAKTSF